MTSEEPNVVDPRPIAMFLHRYGFDRIIARGGVIVCFANSRNVTILFDQYRRRSTNAVKYESWGFSKLLSSELLVVEQASGHDMDLYEKVLKKPLGRLLQSHLRGASFLCSFAPQKRTPEKINFEPLIKNKFGRPVGAILTPTNSPKAGLILILPQLSDKATFLTHLLTDILPDFVPSLFPELVSGRWLTDPDYEIPQVLKLRNNIENIRQVAQGEIDQIEARINVERETWGYLHDLLNGTGDCLVDAVEKTFNLLGFERTTNVDNEIEAGRENIRKREDLRIEKDGRPELVVEVRGISNLPSDEDCFGAEKHLLPRARERSDVEVKGLTIINHERNLPPLDRQNDKVFREEVITNTTERNIGLLTTWNLYRLARSYLKYGWKHEQIEHLFYHSGPIIPVPNHYSELGTIGRIFDRESGTIMGIEVQSDEITEGDIIAVELQNEFEEQTVISLEIRGESVPKAMAGDQVGVLTDIDGDWLRKRMRVFRVSSS